MSKFKLSDIGVDDGVYINFDHPYHQDLYWTVVSISKDGIIEIELNEMGVKDKIYIKINDVYSIEKRTKGTS